MLTKCIPYTNSVRAGFIHIYIMISIGLVLLYSCVSQMWQIERKSGGASGRSLLDALDAMERPPKLERYPLRIAVHSVYKLGTACKHCVDCISVHFLFLAKTYAVRIKTKLKRNCKYLPHTI